METTPMKTLVETIGVPAMLEQTAEECAELAFACLKYARYLRGENKVYGYFEDQLKSKIEEEFADVDVCLKQLCIGNAIDYENVYGIQINKYARMQRRLSEESDEQG